MNYKDWTKKRMDFKERVVAMAAADPSLTFEEVGQAFGISRVRVCQIRKEMGLPNRTGGHRPKVKGNGAEGVV